MVSIPQYVKKNVDEILIEDKNEHSKTILVIGSKFVGKSTLLNLFLEKSDPPRETLVLEYSFGRKLKQKQGFEKAVCHVWEYGGKLTLLKEVLTHIPKHGHSTYVIVVDLSNIKNLWNTLDPCLHAVDGEFADMKNAKNTPDLFIIGAKYDLFNNYDTQVKKLLCTTLRSVALLYGAHLLFYSSREPILVKRMKEYLHYLGFGSGSLPKDKITNPNKPLLILKNSDSWESIGVQSTSLNQVKTRYISAVPQEVSEDVTHRHRLSSTHVEPELDALLTVKYDELRYLDGLEIAIDEYLDMLR